MFNVLINNWIPVVSGSGKRDIVSFTDIGKSDYVDIDWGRPDFRVATYELLIGLLAAFAAPEDGRSFRRWFINPPDKAQLHDLAKPYLGYFTLEGGEDGVAPRFMQDFEGLEGELLKPQGLLIDAPGGNTVKKNADFFVRNDEDGVFGRPGAMIALFALQAFAPSGGAGHRTSMRGGGPMTTLVDPVMKDGNATLWHKLWAHVPVLEDEDQLTDAEASAAFPWCEKMRTSEKGQTVEEGHVHKLQAYFGMPRRIRLVFEKNVKSLRCALTGIVDDVVVTGYVTRPYGANYGAWRHPLSPYYQMKEGAEYLPLHPRGGTFKYRDWAGVSLDTDLRHRASSVVEFINRKPESVHTVEVIVTGYAMNNASVKEFIEAQAPLYEVREEIVGHVTRFLQALLSGADTAAFVLRSSLVEVRDGKDAVITTFEEAFWAETETVFRTLIGEAVSAFDKAALPREGDDPFIGLKERWRAHICRISLALFDEAAPAEKILDMKPDVAQKYIAARSLMKALPFGSTSSSKRLFKSLELRLPEKLPAKGSLDKKGKIRETT